MLDSLNAIVDFIFSGIYDFFVDLTSYWIQVSVKWSLYLTLAALQFSWDVAQDILADLNINAALETAWSSLDSETYQTVLFFQIPQSVGNLVTAFVTRFVYSKVGAVAMS